MRLPAGVFDRPRQRELIAKDEWAIMRINTEGYQDNTLYRVDPRQFEDCVQPYLHGDWEEFNRLFCLSRWRTVHVRGQPVKARALYSRAEHFGTPRKGSRKLPNITVVPNLAIEEASGLARPYTVLGCTMGQYHPPSPTGPRVQEVYEFQTYGCLALDREEHHVELWVGQDGDKVVVPSGCHKTLYNLGDEDYPLITLDFANLEGAPPVDDLARTFGPVLLVYYDDFEVVFTLNRLYVNNPSHRAGVWLAHTLRERQDREIRIRRHGRLDLGRLLYEELTLNPETIGAFACLGIRIRKAKPEAVLEPLSSGKGARLYFSQSLVEVTEPGTEVYRFFFPESEPLAPRGPLWRPLADELRDPPETTVAKGPLCLNRRMMVVVEGVGDWVEQAYRPLFRKKFDEGKPLSVFYADDTRWKRRPAWADPNCSSPDPLQDWEVYLDKADPDDFARYRLLRPDVVFVVTPDFTHSAVARHWLGKSPLIFVEKPFDSQVKSVEDLLLDLGDSRTTMVLGLDHYQFYALAIDRLKPTIDRHLGWALARINFCLLENRAIEVDRVRSLQHGLTLDLLPHFAALLTYFGDIRTIDQIHVLDARQYDPLDASSRDGQERQAIEDQFRNETYSRVQFTFKDSSGNGFPIPCHALVGKGCRQEIKYMEVRGYNGNAIRIDLRKPPKEDRSRYPWYSLFFLQGDREPVPRGWEEYTIPDPYPPNGPLRILHDPNAPERLSPRLKYLRYEDLLDDLFNGTESAIGGTISLTEGLEIVRALDRIWWAIQRSQPWSKYPLGEFSPLDESTGRKRD